MNVNSESYIDVLNEIKQLLETDFRKQKNIDSIEIFNNKIKKLRDFQIIGFTKDFLLNLFDKPSLGVRQRLYRFLKHSTIFKQIHFKSKKYLLTDGTISEIKSKASIKQYSTIKDVMFFISD